MYFISRNQAGEKLADELADYCYEPCVVVALGYGSLLVGEPIAKKLNCDLTIMLAESIGLPGEFVNIGTVSQSGSFTYNKALTPGEVSDYYSEFHGFIEDQKREKLAKMNRIVGRGGPVGAQQLKNKIVILVADGLKTGLSLDAAMDFLKPIKTKRLVIAAPIASVQAVDRMHVLADELRCLSVTENYINTDHYYDENNLPSNEELLAKIS